MGAEGVTAVRTSGTDWTGAVGVVHVEWEAVTADEEVADLSEGVVEALEAEAEWGKHLIYSV